MDGCMDGPVSLKWAFPPSCFCCIFWSTPDSAESREIEKISLGGFITGRSQVESSSPFFTRWKGKHRQPYVSKTIAITQYVIHDDGPLYDQGFQLSENKNALYLYLYRSAFPK